MRTVCVFVTWQIVGSLLLAFELGEKFKKRVTLVAGLLSDPDDKPKIGPAGAERVSTVSQSTHKSADKVRDSMVCFRLRKVIFLKYDEDGPTLNVGWRPTSGTKI